MPSPLKKTPALNQPTTRAMKSAAPPKTMTTGVATTTQIATVIRLRMLQGSERISDQADDDQDCDDQGHDDQSLPMHKRNLLLDVLRYLGLRNQDLVLAF